ncbi:hypothetical protein KAU33_15965 [Candidatus Dependentiae bacterium]|nr:hypothetical protein [Candidatus Dependentiae bacterium]
MTYKISIYDLEIVDEQVINFPPSAKIMSAGEQWRKVVIYVLKDVDEEETVPVTIKLVQTGDNFDNFKEFGFIGTVKLSDSHSVWHVFWRL